MSQKNHYNKVMPQQQKTKRYNSTVILEENRSNLEVTEELL